jgi:NIMA (never in mitosis gene a)-related kinase
VKLGDFGVAKALEHTTDLAKTIAGTPYYLAPELWESQPYNMAADVWSLGAVLYELTCLRKPFNGKSPTELLVAVMRNSRQPIPESYSTDLRDLIDRMLAHEATGRPTAEAIKGLPFIRTAIQNLITFNRGQLEKPGAKSVKKSRIPLPRKGGQKSILPKYVPPKPTTPVKSEGHAASKLLRPDELRKDSQTMKSMDFPPDFIDFEEEDDDRPDLLAGVTEMLESSLQPMPA